MAKNLNETMKIELEVTQEETRSHKYFICTVCPVSSDPFYIASLLYKMGHYFLDILYVNKNLLNSINNIP